MVVNLEDFVGGLVHEVDYRHDVERMEWFKRRFVGVADAIGLLYYSALGAVVSSKHLIRGGFLGAAVGTGLGAVAGQNLLEYAISAGVCIDAAQVMIRHYVCSLE